jgi:hypothetical protein
VPTKRSAKDFIFGKVVGEGSFSTVSFSKKKLSKKKNVKLSQY